MDAKKHGSAQAKINDAFEFLSAIRSRGPWTLAGIDPESRIHAPYFNTFSADGKDIKRYLARACSAKNVNNRYFQPNTADFIAKGYKKPKEEQIIEVNCAYVEGDPLDGEVSANARTRLRALADAKIKAGKVPPATMIYETGNGIALLWIFRKPVRIQSDESIKFMKSINAGLAKALGGKEHGWDDCQNLDRLLRLPFTTNFPDERKRKKGRVVEQAGNVEFFPAHKYDADDLNSDFPTGEVTETEFEEVDVDDAVPVDDLDDWTDNKRLKEMIRKGRVKMDVPPSDQTHSGWHWQFIYAANQDGKSAEEIAGILADPQYAIGETNSGHLSAAQAVRQVRRVLGKISLSSDNFEEDMSIFDAEPVAADKKINLYTGVSYSALMRLPEPKWLVEGMIFENCLFEIYGRWKAGKTFFGIELALCIATGLLFFDGVTTTQGRVIYVIAEGNRRKFGNRIAAWIEERAGGDKERMRELQQLVEQNFFVVGTRVPMDAEKEVSKFLKANPGTWSAVFVDTLMRNMTGHPSDPQDMMKFVAGCDTIRARAKAAVIFLHHMKREGGTGGFGSIVGEAFVDGAAIVERKRDDRILRLVLMRDADDDLPGWVCRIERREKIVAMDEDGEKTTDAAVLVYDRREAASADDDPADNVLNVLHLSPEIKKQAQLVEAMGLSKDVISRRVAVLRKAGMIRKDSLKLTAKGIERAESFDDESDFG